MAEGLWGLGSFGVCHHVAELPVAGDIVVGVSGSRVASGRIPRITTKLSALETDPSREAKTCSPRRGPSRVVCVSSLCVPCGLLLSPCPRS